MPLYWPTLVWGLNLCVLIVLVWWSEYGLTRHAHWSFAAFATTLLLPALLYMSAGLLLPAHGGTGPHDMRATYQRNRVWFFAFQGGVIGVSFVQSYFLDGHVTLNVDSALKAAVMLVVLLPVVSKAERLQQAVAGVSLAWLVLYISLLFSNLRYS